ncbi:MAG: 30S ribosomal protein S8 [Clostridia bacterium]|nr:30S ribosomal protein S8 [Clostridia bacterium]
MQTTDAIADMLTRIRNASAAKHATVEVPASNMKRSIAQILLEEGYIKGFEFKEDGRQGVIKIALKYGKDKIPAITGIKRVSKPGLRIYSGCKEMPQVIRGLGVVIVSTSKGVITDRKAKELNVGGEVLAYVW